MVLIEPDEHVRDALGILLQGRGWSTEPANEAGVLTELLERRAVTAVISEASMPGCDAADILLRCSQCRVPVIFTGHNLPAEQAVDLIRKGGLDYLEKPFQQERLLDLLKRLSNRHNE